MARNGSSNRPRAIDARVGGLPDEVRVSLAVYGPDLVPEIISGALGCKPTSGHAQGMRAGPRSPPFEGGAWVLTYELESGQDLGSAVKNLLATVPAGIEGIRSLSGSFKLQLRVAIHTDQWNTSFQIGLETLSVLKEIGVDVMFDIYAYGDDA